MQTNTLMEEKDFESILEKYPSEIVRLEGLLKAYEKGDKEVYPAILTATNHPPVNYFMVEMAAKELKQKINDYKKELEEAKKYEDSKPSLTK